MNIYDFADEMIPRHATSIRSTACCPMPSWTPTSSTAGCSLFFCFYHVGAASWLSEHTDHYWD